MTSLKSWVLDPLLNNSVTKGKDPFPLYKKLLSGAAEVAPRLGILAALAHWGWVSSTHAAVHSLP